MRPIVLPLAVAALAACSASPSARADQLADVRTRTIVVTGLGETSAAPDLATLSIGVETQATTAGAALKQNGAKMRATIERLKARGVAEKDMQTQQLSVQPRYK